MDLKKKFVSTDDELERLRCELEEEKQRKSRLDKRIDHLEQTIEHLVKLYEDDVTNGECQKWRTKYEMQADLNWKLEDDIKSLNRRVFEANQLLKDRNRLKRKSRAAGRMQREEDTVRPFEVKLLEREKLILQGELRNTEHRLDRESQRVYKLDEDCRKIEKDVGIDTYPFLQIKHPQQIQQPIHSQETKKHTSFDSSSPFASSYFVAPNSQRFYDDVNYSSGHRQHPLLSDRTQRTKDRNQDQRKPAKLTPLYNY